ncbi:hypothetical protein V565_228100 [Rhizoctonia solani 123E]|uniref:Uncharacterized protein n=1 Tax=Rhizoctonia solani 123E TaxID=1423351 RepID=A0A074RKS4_9AGAM|nr:hypothetical protein V565_228100 [Rhizoctonia solani 123E]
MNSVKLLNQKLSTLKKDYKNAIQREKRAKLKAQRLQKQAEIVCGQLTDALSARKMAETTLVHLQTTAEGSTREILNLQYHVLQLEGKVKTISRELATTSNKLERQEDEILALQARHGYMHRSRDTSQRRADRARLQIEATHFDYSQLDVHNSPNEYSLKSSSGIIHPEVRNMLRRLTCQGVSTEHASEIINIVAEGLGINIMGSVSARSVARIMLEGLIQARMQVGYDLGQSTYLSICGDGTTIKNQQHEARSIYVQFPQNSGSDSEFDSDPSGPLQGKSSQISGLRTLGVELTTDHTALKQFDGWMSALDTCCHTFNRSPLGQGLQTNRKMVAPKLRGILTNHAADQKRFHRLMQEWKRNCDREERAVSVLKQLSTEEQLYALSKYLDSAAESISDWRLLPNDQQAAIMHDAWFALAAQIGESEFQKLDPNSQFDTDFLAWAGCCMHKELNSVKGGVSGMSAAWENLKLTPPIALWNKHEIEHRAKESDSKLARGAIKLISLAGALFNNKDEKKGYQNSVDFFFESLFGYSKRFPDASHTRYGSYCDAAMELILHQKNYTDLMETLRDAKGSQKFNNIERNVYEGLTDIPTLTELVILALYGQVIGHPYMIYVRTPGHNALDLGAFHNRVKQLCQDIAKDPGLLLIPDPSGALTTLDSKPWDRPEVVYRALCLVPQLPNVYPLLSAFFYGALKAWERFASEFNEEGIIHQASQEQRDSAWVPATNDVSEGALGQRRQMHRRAPTMTDEQFNARVIWKRNETEKWAKEMLTEEDEKYVRREARDLDASGASKARRIAANKALEERAAEGRAKQAKRDARLSSAKQRLAQVVLVEDATYESLQKMKVKDLDKQIDKLREAGDKAVRAKSMLSNKHAKIKEILGGLERRKTTTHIGIEGMDSVGSRMDMDGNSDTEGFPDDAELYHTGDVIF